MTTSSHKPETIDEYISLHPPKVQELLQKIRTLIQRAAPGAKEAINYQIPTFVFNGNLVHFAAYKNHIGFYPTSRGIEEFKKEFINYKWSKGAVQFPLNEPLPKQLITRIVRSRVTDEKIKAESKQKK